MPDLLARLCDPTPLAWVLGAPASTPFSLPPARYAEVRLGRHRLLLGHLAPDAPLHLSVRHGQGWRRLLLAVPDGLPPHASPSDALAALERARQAGRAREVLARLALLLDLARLALQRHGHAQGQISVEGGLDGLAPGGAIGLLARTPLPQALPPDLLREVLAAALVPNGGILLPAADTFLPLEAPRSAHAALDLRRAAFAATAALPPPWRGRFAQALARTA